MSDGNMKECKHCKEMIPKSAKRCSKCGGDQRSFFARHKIISGILILVVLGVIGGMLGGDKELAEQEEIKTEYNIGEVISLDKYDILIENQREIKGVTDTTYTVFDATVMAKKDDFKFFGDIQGVNSQNEVVNNTIPFVSQDLGDPISIAWTKTLNSGQKATGYLAFDKPIDKIELRKDSFDKNVITINLK